MLGVPCYRIKRTYMTILHVKQGDVNAPIFFNIFRDSTCRYIKSKAGDLGLKLTNNIDGHMTGRRNQIM